MCFIGIFVIFVSWFFSTRVPSILIFMLIPCVLVFSTRRFFFLYLFYELSLVPILYIILKWGSYPERSVSAIILLIYTAIFTLPFLGCLFRLYFLLGSFSISYVSSSTFSWLFTFVVFIAFAVKLPVYGLHFWLPIAHVEAPTFGSIILAGALLKLGGVGIVRFLPLLDTIVLRMVCTSYLLVFLALSSLICCFQSDFKRLVAYSSISHMICIPLLCLREVIISTKAVIIVIFFHGLSSPLIFMLVGISYFFFGRRQLALTRGLILFSPLLSLIVILSFFFTLSAPPYPSFLSEVLFFIASYRLSSSSLLFFIVFIFFSLVYNLNWLNSILFGPSVSATTSKLIQLSSFLPLIFSHLLSFLFLFLIPLF